MRFRLPLPEIRIKEHVKTKIFIVIIIAILWFAARASLRWYSMKDMTPEEKQIYYEMEEEAQRGYRLLNSHQLTEQEIQIRNLFDSLQAGDTKQLCAAMGVPDVFDAESYNKWLNTTGLSELKGLPYDSVGVLSRDETVNTEESTTFNQVQENQTAYYLFDNNDRKNKIVRFVYSKDSQSVYFRPDNGIIKNFVLLSPTKDLYPNIESGNLDNEDSLLKYVITSTDCPYTVSDQWKSTWYQFTFPYFLNVEEPHFMLHTDIGTFKSAYLVTSSYSSSLNTVIAVPTEDQSDALVSDAQQVIATIFEKVQQDASKSDLSDYVISEDLADTLVAPPENTYSYGNTYTEIIDSIRTVEKVSLQLSSEAEGTMPLAYNCRIFGSDGVVLKVNAKLSTTDGECRKTTFIYMRYIEGKWKLAGMSNNNNNNLFWNITPFDPQW